MNSGQGRDLDQHQHGIDPGAFGGADDQQPGHRGGDQNRGHIDPAADLAARHAGRAWASRRTAICDLGHQRVGVADGGGKIQPSPCSRPTAWLDQPTATALAPTAYSRISAQPTIQAISSPTTA